MERISVRVSQQLKEELKSEAREKGVSASDIVREALEKHVRRRTPKESCLDIALRIGFIGAYKNTLPNLSTNEEYMEGFGHS